MRLLTNIRLDQRLFRWYGLTALSILMILGIALFSIVSTSVNREIRASLKNTNRSIEEIVNYGASLEIRHQLTAQVNDAMAKIEDIYRTACLNDGPENAAKKEAAEFLLSRKIGKEGYFAVLDSAGTVIVHPFMKQLSPNLSDIPSIRHMIETRRGFMEYQWKNPDDPKERTKALAMDYFPEWDWIIAAAAYRTDFPFIFNIGNLKDFVLSQQIGKRGYSFVMDTRGHFLIHPGTYDGKPPLGESGGESGIGTEIIRKMASTDSGFLSYTWHTEGSGTWEKKLLHYVRIEDFGWIVASTVYLSDVQAPLRQLGAAIILLCLGNLLIFLLLSARFSRIITRPMDQLVSCLNSGQNGDYSQRVEPFGVRELDALGNHFNHFMEQLEQGRVLRQDLGSLRLLSEAVFENTIEGIVLTDLDGTITQVNQAFTNITGFSSQDALGKNPRILKSDHHPPEFYEEMWQSIQQKGSWSGEIWNRRKDGDAYPEWMTITALRDDENNPMSYISIFHDISDQKRTEARLKYQAYHDALTSLPNRELFRDRLDMALAASSRNGDKGAVIFLDLDNFKNVNDSQGHSVGDQFLREISLRLEAAVREADTVARLGGDEFTILLPKIADQKAAIEVVQRVINAIEEPVFLQQKTIHPRGSYGITFFPDDGTDSNRLMRNADMAMYRSKHRGDGSYTLFNEHIERRSQRRTILEERLRRAVVAGHLQVHYQPQYDIRQEGFSGFEALIRWNDPEEGWISPDEFIPIAEMSGLISPIDTWLLRRALREIGSLNKSRGEELTLSVNISAVQFKEEGFVESILAALKESGFPPRLLELEITEGTAMENVSVTVRKMEQLSERGVGFAIDDFGTGYSSLSYLSRLRASTLKIDRSFIKELDVSPEASAIATSIIGLGNTLGLKVVAEGVETEDQLEFIRRHECPIVQGYFYARPMPYTALPGFLESFSANEGIKQGESV